METKTKTDKKSSALSKFLGFVVYMIVIGSLFVFASIVFYIDYLSYLVVAELDRITALGQNITEINLTIEATGFLDYFLRFQLPIVIIGVFAVVIVAKFIGFVIRRYLTPYYEFLRDKRRDAWRKYLNSGITYKDFTEEQLKSLNLRKKAIEFDLYVLLSLVIAFIFAIWMVMFFFELDDLGDPRNNAASLMVIGVFLFGLMLFVEWGRKREKPIFPVEKRIKEDENWQEFLDEKDKEKDTDTDDRKKTSNKKSL